MKILHLIKSLGRGGAETLLPESIRLHNRSKFEFEVVYFLPWKNEMVDELEETGVQVTCLNRTNNLSLLLSLKEVERLVKSNDIDLIHAHLPWAGFLARLIGVKTGIPVIYTEHNLQERYHWLTRRLNRLTFSMQTMAVAVSEDVRTSIRKNINSTVPVLTISNGVNTEKYQCSSSTSWVREELNLTDGEVLIGTVAVFRTQKRLSLWLQIAEKIAKRHHCKFVLIGSGPEEDLIKKQLKRLQIKDSVYLPGRLRDVAPWLDAIDIYMITSKFEGLPVAMLEAMSMEIPVITTDAGGIGEVVRDEMEGFVVPVDSPFGLVEGAIKLIEDPILRKTMARNARERVCTSFSANVMVGKYGELYDQVFNGNSSGD